MSTLRVEAADVNAPKMSWRNESTNTPRRTGRQQQKVRDIVVFLLVVKLSVQARRDERKRVRKREEEKEIDGTTAGRCPSF